MLGVKWKNRIGICLLCNMERGIILATRKGKLGIAYTFYAVLAFVLLLFGNFTVSALLLGLVIVLERDEWTSRQCMQAFFLSFVSSIASSITYAFTGVAGSFGVLGEFLLGTGNLILSIVAGIINLIVFVFTILGLVRVMKGEEANLPLFSKWAYKAFGYVQQTMPAQQPASPAQGNPYQQQPPPQQPYYPQQSQPVSAPRPMAPPPPTTPPPQPQPGMYTPPSQQPPPGNPGMGV